MFDSHFHIINSRFPLIANHGYMPKDFTCEDYLHRVSGYKLHGGAIVSGSFQGFDQSYLLDALKTLGHSFVGVTQLPASVTDDEIIQLNNAGVRAVRFNLKRGGSENIRHLSSLAERIHDVAGWHVELYVDSSELSNMFDTLVSLPTISIDHMGLSKTGLSDIKRLMEKGARVKVTGFGRLDFDVSRVLKELYAINPGSLMFGTDLPSTRSPVPFSDEDYQLVLDCLGEDDAEDVLSRNAISFYKPRESSLTV